VVLKIRSVQPVHIDPRVNQKIYFIKVSRAVKQDWASSAFLPKSLPKVAFIAFYVFV